MNASVSSKGISRVLRKHDNYKCAIRLFPFSLTASCTTGTGSFPCVKRPRRGTDHPPPFSTRQCRQERGEADANCRARRSGTGPGGPEQGPAVRKGARGPTMSHMFLYFSVVSLFLDCTN
jgi:hypothetical protein